MAYTRAASTEKEAVRTMNRMAWDITLRATPALGGLICIVIAARMTSRTGGPFVALLIEGAVLVGLAVFLVRRYLATPPADDDSGKPPD